MKALARQCTLDTIRTSSAEELKHDFVYHVLVYLIVHVRLVARIKFRGTCAMCNATVQNPPKRRYPAKAGC